MKEVDMISGIQCNLIVQKVICMKSRLVDVSQGWLAGCIIAPGLSPSWFLFTILTHMQNLWTYAIAWHLF